MPRAIAAMAGTWLARMAWLLLVYAALATAACGSASADEQTVSTLLKPLNLVAYRPGTRPPAFSGKTADARALSLSELHGKVVIVNFWASWCSECRPEMPALQRLHRELSPRGLAIVGINAGERAQTIRRYARAVGLSFPLVLDSDGSINSLYGVVGLPATFVIARDGRAVAFVVGAREWASAPARALIEALLAEPAGHT